MTLRVLALDLSLTATGVCNPDGVATLIKSKRAGMARLAEIRDAVWLGGVDLVVVEGYSYGTTRQANNAHDAGELGGVIRLHLYECDVPYVDVAPGSLKKFATGKGNAKKDAVLAAAVRAGYAGDDNNESDAWWLRQMALYHYGPADVPRTAYRDEAGGKVAWPDLAGLLAPVPAPSAGGNQPTTTQEGE